MKALALCFLLAGCGVTVEKSEWTPLFKGDIPVQEWKVHALHTWRLP
jgi:hypothetical protein